MERQTLLNLFMIFLAISYIFLIFNNYGLNKQNKATKELLDSCIDRNQLLQDENTAQLNKLMENANIIQLQNDFLVELEPKVQECEQDNTAYLELFNRCSFLDTENYQYVQFPIGVNVTELLKPKVIHTSSTHTEYITETEYIVCDECPSLQRCPAGKTMQCLSVNACGCSTDCSCVGSNID